MDEDEAIRQVREAEQRRGRRPLDADEKRKRERLLRGFREALLKDDPGLFEEIIVHDLGFEPGSPEYENAWREWKRLRASP